VLAGLGIANDIKIPAFEFIESGVLESCVGFVMLTTCNAPPASSVLNASADA